MSTNGSPTQATQRSAALTEGEVSERPKLLDRRQFLRTTGVVGLTVSGGAALAACDPAEDPDDAAVDLDDEPDDADVDDAPDTDAEAGEFGDTLTLRIVQDVRNIDPAFFPATVDACVGLCVFENLVTFLPGSLEVSNELAEEFEISDDGLEIEFKLKEGIQFHGGYGELTTEDVKFSFERIAGLTEPDIESTYRGDWAALAEVEIIDDYRGIIRLSEPFPALMSTTIPANAGMIVSKAAVEELGEDFATNPIGTGPYEFVEWRRGEEVVLRRFEGWSEAALEWAEGPPEWDEIRMLPIEDDSSAEIAVATGEAEFGLIPHDAVERFEDEGDFDVVTQPTQDYGWIGFNVTDEVVGDLEVRRAIRQALDIDAMIEAAFDGQTTRANALVSPETPIGYWEDAPVYQPDPDAARQILEDAGYDELDIEMSIVDEPGARTIAEITQANLAEIGINVEIRQRERDEMSGPDVSALQMFYYSFSNSADPSWATVWFTSDQIDEWNTMSWSNEEYDELHEQALTETDEDARHQMYVRMQEIMDEEAVAVWVQYRTRHYAYQQGLEPSLVSPHYGKYRPWDIRTTA